MGMLGMFVFPTHSSQQANSALAFGITGERRFGGSNCSLLYELFLPSLNVLV